MSERWKANGFSLVEVLLVLAIIGIISGIAIPAYLGQRRRARVIGDAISNAKSLAMLLESRKAENGIYGTAGVSYSWTSSGQVPTTSNIAPSFTPKGNSKMDYTVAIGSTGLTYNLQVFDTTLGGTRVYETDQSGAEKYRLQ